MVLFSLNVNLDRINEIVVEVITVIIIVTMVEIRLFVI